MKITPIKKKMTNAMDDSNRFLAYTIVLGLFSLVLMGVSFLLADSILSVLTFVISIVICLIKTYHLFTEMKEAKAKVTDVNGSMIELKDEYLICYQTNGDVYEDCSIAYDEISSVTEITKRGRCGFLISIVNGADSRRSYIRANDMIVNESIFEVKGGLYDTDKFIALYNGLLERIPADIKSNTKVREFKKNWYSKTKIDQLKMLLIPMIISIILIVIPILLKKYNII